MKLLNTLPFLLFVLGFQNAYAQQTMPFDRVAARLAASDPSGSIAVVAAEGEKAALRADILPADPEVEMEYLWPSVAGEHNRWSVGISQELPDFRRMALTRRAISALDSMAVHTREAARAEALRDARGKLLDYIGARRRLALRRQVAADMDSLLAAYTRAWDHGEVNILDLNKIRIQQARAAAALEEARGEVTALASDIEGSSAGMVSATDLDGLDTYPLWPDYAAVADFDDGRLADLTACSPAMRAADAAVDVASAKAGLSTGRNLPALSLGYQHAYEDGTHFNGFTAAVTLPVFSRRSSREAALAQYVAQQTEAARSASLLLASARQTATRARSLRQTVALLAPAVDNTNNLRLLRMALEGGEINLIEYLQETAFFTEATEEYNAALLEYYRCLSELGSLLPSGL